MASWELWRQDDNGNRYLISKHEDRDGAEVALAEMESGPAHKQIYWIAEADRGQTNPADR